VIGKILERITLIFAKYWVRYTYISRG